MQDLTRKRLFFAGSLSPEVRVLYSLADHLPNGDAELVGRWPADEVPAIENPVNREVGQKREGKGDREGTVTPVCRLAYAELVCERQLGVTQEGELGTQTRLEGFLDSGGINGDNRQPAIGNFCASMELDQFPQLNLSLRSPRSPVESKDQRLTPCQLRDRRLLLPVIDQAHRGELLSYLIPECH